MKPRPVKPDPTTEPPGARADVRVVFQPPERHDCRLPGWLARRRMGVRFGTVVECLTCGQRYEWDGDMHGNYWSRARFDEGAGT